jgi:glycerophosphoryl diester phosphodiesterase
MPWPGKGGLSLSTLLIAHRGGTDRYPELTLDAARYSWQAGADYCEFDVRFIKDEIPVLCHDSDGQRLFGISAKISDLSLTEFTALRYAADHRYAPHTLDDLLRSEPAALLFHVKDGGDRLSIILETIRKYGHEAKSVLGVTTVQDVQRVKSFNPQMKVLAFMPDPSQTQAFIRAGADIIRYWEEWVQEAAVHQIHMAGKQIWVMAGLRTEEAVGYTDPANILTWKQMGVDGILVNEVVKTSALL